VRFHYRISWEFLRLIERLLFGMRIHGDERVPQTGGVIIASNHISYNDPPMVGSAVPRELHFLAKEELFENPVFAALISSYNAMPVKRATGDVGALKKAVRLLKDGRAMIMFPEGTRSLSGKFLKPKPGVGMIASMADVPVVPTYVAGTNNLGAAFWRKRPVVVRFGEPVIPAEVRGRCGSDREAYMAISSEAMERIKALAEEDRKERGAPAEVG
jgi:1-acyl-sn-glycerol-3-phosphate acyltransferase